MALGSEEDFHVEPGKVPDQPSAGFDRLFEPCLFNCNTPIEEDFDRPLLVAGEFPYLQPAGVGGSFPIDIARVVVGFVGSDGVEFMPESARKGFEFACEVVECKFRGVMGVDGRVDGGFAAQRDGGGFTEESEGKMSGKDEEIFLVTAPVREGNFDLGLDGLASRDERKVDGTSQDRRLVGERVAAARELDREGRQQDFQVAKADFGGRGRTGRNVFREEQFQFQTGEDESAEKAGNQQKRQHGGKDQEEQIIGGEERSGPGGCEGDREEPARAGDPVPDSAAQ